MLILTRRAGEAIIMQLADGQIAKAVVLGVKGNQVRIGIDAPKDTVVHREEIYQRILDGVPKKSKSTDNEDPDQDA